jgi:hypothetical protein
MLILFSGFEPRGLIGDLDELAVFGKTLSEIDIQNHYAVGKYSPNHYLPLMEFDGADGIYSFEDAGPYINGLSKVSPGEYTDIKLSMQATDCSDSASFALNPANNKISFVIMDSDAAPRDQVALQEDENLNDDEQLVNSGIPYQGICTLEWNNTEAELSFVTNDSSSVWGEINLNPMLPYSLEMSFDGGRINIEIVLLPHENEGEWVERSVVFKTGFFPLDFRLRGGVGWKSELIDMHSSVQRILIQDVQFAEYRSAPLRSRIPYSGAQIFKSGTPPLDLAGDIGVSASDWGGSIDPDLSKSKSGKSYKVNTTGQLRYEGIKTGRFFIQNPNDARIAFKTISAVNLEVFLYCYETDQIVPVHAHYLTSSEWVELDREVSVTECGYYALYVTSSSFGEWYVDELSIKSPSIAWSARPDQEDKWLPMKNVVDSQYGGVKFDHAGKNLQVQGVSKFVDGTIHDIQIMPKYAELGKIVWEDEAVNG